MSNQNCFYDHFLVVVNTVFSLSQLLSSTKLVNKQTNMNLGIISKTKDVLQDAIFNQFQSLDKKALTVASLLTKYPWLRR